MEHNLAAMGASAPQNLCSFRDVEGNKCGAPAAIGGFLCGVHAKGRQCTATSKTSGEQCRRAASPGTNVCSTHGAMSPAVRRSAAYKLVDLIEPALRALYAILEDPKALHSDKIRAAKEVMDRVEGYAPIKERGGIPGMVGEILAAQQGAITLILANPEAQRGLDAAAREAAKVLPTGPARPVKSAESARERIQPGPAGPFDDGEPVASAESA